MESETNQEDPSDFAEKDWEERFVKWADASHIPHNLPRHEPGPVVNVRPEPPPVPKHETPLKVRPPTPPKADVPLRVLSAEDILNVIAVDMASPEPGRQWLDPIAFKEVVSDEELDQLFEAQSGDPV
jgi:hypothetical protein